MKQLDMTVDISNYYDILCRVSALTAVISTQSLRVIQINKDHLYEIRLLISSSVEISAAFGAVTCCTNLRSVGFVPSNAEYIVERGGYEENLLQKNCLKPLTVLKGLEILHLR